MPSFARLFDRYVQAHLDIRLEGPPIHDPIGQVVGYAEQIRLHQQRITVTGWAQVDDVTLRLGDHCDCAAPSIHRSDVNAALGCDAADTLGFSVSVPLATGPIWLTAKSGGHFLSSCVHHLTTPDLARFRRKLRGPFVRDMLRAAPAGLRWALTRSPADRATIKRRLGLEVAPSSTTICANLFSETPPQEMPEVEITIILPIYNAFDLLPEVLQRVLDHTDLPWRLIAVEDFSTDTRVRPFLRNWLESLPKSVSSKITLIENDQNLGFIRSVNTALKRALRLGNHVVLLNSDALVPSGWASRLLRPILADERVASVTPMSNDAEIFTVPAICNRTDLAAGEADRIDATAQTLHAGATLASAPTGVGFCMAMNLDFLRREPRLDTAFGKGYGEEVDWCQKTRALGGTHLVTPALFVEHRGGASFGSETKRKLIETNNRRIADRYPTYDAEVQHFILGDPVAPARLALTIALAAIRQKGPMPVYLGHLMGGGAEDDLMRRVQSDLDRDFAAIVLRVGGESLWRVDLHGPWGVTQAQAQDFADVEKLLSPVGPRDVTYSCAVGGAQPMQLPEQLLALGRGGRFACLVHDFFVVSPAYTLLDSDGAYRGAPDPANPDRAHCWGPVSLAEWQGAWGKFLDHCDRIEVFSKNSADIVARAYPEVASNILIKPHRLITTVSPVSPSKGQRTIGVLGNIGFQKGAAVLSQLSLDLARDGSAKLAILGNIDPSFPLHPSAQIHGSYDRKDIANLTRDYGITDWLIPSIWPETFSFTTHEALATGLPVWSFDLGAQAEAIRAAPNRGGVIPLAETDDPSSAILSALNHNTKTEAA